MAQGVHECDRFRDVRPHLVEQLTIACMTVVFGDEVNEFSVAVILRNRIRASRVDAARDLAVVELIRREPLDELLHFFRVAEPEQCSRGQGSISNP